MKSYVSVCALALVVGACSGSSPFTVVATGTGTPTTTPTTTPVTTIPAEVQGSLTSFSYIGGQSLVVTGISLDEEDVTATYRRRTNLDILAPDNSIAYEAYTAQDDPLDEHTTAYVKTISDVTAALAVTGGQFTYSDGGTLYTRTGAYDPVEVSESNDTGLVSYAGSYIGLSNVTGVDTDLTPTAGTPPTAILPTQASVVNGSIFINVDFADNELKGIIYDRTLTIPGTEPTPDPDPALVPPVDEILPNLILVPTSVSSDGSFNGTVEIPGRTIVGAYGGILGGENSNTIAGSLYSDNHFEDQRLGEEEEYGIFVLGQCGTSASNDPALCASGAAE